MLNHGNHNIIQDPIVYMPYTCHIHAISTTTQEFAMDISAWLRSVRRCTRQGPRSTGPSTDCPWRTLGPRRKVTYGEFKGRNHQRWWLYEVWWLNGIKWWLFSTIRRIQIGFHGVYIKYIYIYVLNGISLGKHPNWAILMGSLKLGLKKIMSCHKPNRETSDKCRL